MVKITEYHCQESSSGHQRGHIPRHGGEVLNQMLHSLARKQKQASVSLAPFSNKNNKKVLVKLIEELQDYLIQIDPLKRLRRLPQYGEMYIKTLLQKIKKQDGIIYIAESENTPVGMIAGIIEEQTEKDKLECMPSKPARILELIVSEKHRGHNIGSLLMTTLEGYFQKKGCDIIRVEVFEPNKTTHHFYQKLNYQDRAVEMVKKI